MCHCAGAGDEPGDDADNIADRLFARRRELLRPYEEEVPDEDSPLSDAERVLAAYAQLYRMHRAGRLAVHPRRLAVVDVARVVGVADDIEFVTADALGEHHHFAATVLTVVARERFPWSLQTVWEWAADQELFTFDTEDGS